MGHGLINGGSKLLLALVAIVLVPLMLKGLGTDLFGLWLFASMVTDAVATIADLGVQLTVIREVGAAGNEHSEVAPFIRAAANFYLRIMILGALAIIGTGLALASRRQSTVVTPGLVTKVFIIVAAGFIADQMCSLQLSVLQGLRRFDLSNLIAVSTCLLNAFAIVCVLSSGGRLLAVVQAEAAVSILSLVAAYAVVAAMVPAFRQKPHPLELDILRPQMSFSLLSQASVLANATLWNGPPMLIGLMLGPAALVPYQLGCKFPLAAGNIAWELTTAIIPASSRHQRTNCATSTAQTLETGTRLVVVLTLPVYIILWIAAPYLLTAWLGRVPEGTVLVLRLMVVASAISACDAAAASLLTGRGMVGFLSATVFGVALVALPLTAYLLRRLGPVGAAWALMFSAPVAAVLMLRAAADVCGVALSDLARRIARRVWIPAMVCACAALITVRSLHDGRWFAVIAAALSGGLGYFIAYAALGAHEEERRLMRFGIDALADLFLAAVKSAYPLLRSFARICGLQASRHPKLAGVVYSIRDPYRQVGAFDVEYERAHDPWKYTTDSSKRELHLMALGMLEAVRPPQGFGRVLEIGCAEGVFTEMLAPLCGSLMAVDFSDIALQRARERCVWGAHVTFSHWNLRSDQIPGHFDLIVAMDVLGYIRRPGKLRAAFDRLVSSMRAGDILFAGDFRESFDESWLAKRLHFGGRWAIEELARYPGLQRLQRTSTPTHEFVVLRKL